MSDLDKPALIDSDGRKYYRATNGDYHPAIDNMGTCIPKYAEQHDLDSLRQLVEYLDKRLIECERELMAMQGDGR